LLESDVEVVATWAGVVGVVALQRPVQIWLDGFAMMNRGRIAAPGGLIVATVGVVAGALSVGSGWIDTSPVNVTVFFLCILMAPMTLVGLWLVRGSVGVSGVPLETLAIAVSALVATPLHPFFQGRWAAIATILGLSLWLLCALIVAGAPA